MFTNNKRILRLMIISVLLNSILFTISYILNLPLWLDTTGTIYVSCILGAPAGFIVAIINNVAEAIFFYGDQSLFFYFVSLFTAFISGWIAKKYNHSKVKKWIYMLIILILVVGFFSVVITFLANGGVPSNYWSKYIYDYMMDKNIKSVSATIVAVLAIKIPDIIVTIAIVMFALRCTPKKLKDTNIIILDTIEDVK